MTEGLHYCTGDVHISANGLTAHVTIVAEGLIQFSSTDSNFEAYVDGLVLFANYEFPPTQKCNQWVIKSTIQGGSFTGFVFAPNGCVDFAASGQHVTDGGIVAWCVDISGNEFTLRYNDEICDDRADFTLVRLVE
jgi:hypothetical protein